MTFLFASMSCCQFISYPIGWWYKYWPLLVPSIPISCVSKSLLPGGKQIKHNIIFHDLRPFFDPIREQILFINPIPIYLRWPILICYPWFENTISTIDRNLKYQTRVFYFKHFKTNKYNRTFYILHCWYHILYICLLSYSWGPHSLTSLLSLL